MQRLLPRAPGFPRRLRVMPPLLGLLWAGSSPVTGQVLTGQLVDRNSGEPVAFAQVYLLQEAGQLVQVVEADDRGLFRFEPAAVGSYWVQATSVGFEPIQAGTLDLQAGKELQVRIQMRPVYNLESLDVTVERQSAVLRSVGFYEREVKGIGSFIGREELEGRPRPRLSDYMRRVPGAMLTSPDRAVYFRRAQELAVSGGVCYPRVAIDGVVILAGGRNDPATLDRLLHPDQVEGIEVYTGGTGIPERFSGTGASCGLILLWTR